MIICVDIWRTHQKAICLMTFLMSALQALTEENKLWGAISCAPDNCVLQKLNNYCFLDQLRYCFLDFDCVQRANP